jgi:hypothetical protein
MSMLTPPGMGGKYRIAGNHYPRMRRPRNHRRVVLAGLSTVTVLGLIGWGTVQLIDVFGGHLGFAHRNAAQGSHCRNGSSGSPADVLPKPSSITVNIYNATPRTGLAKATADQLRQRGFTIGKIGNAPAQYTNKVTGTALLLGGPRAQSALKVLGTQLATGQDRTDPTRTGADVDLVIGNGFGNLDPKPNADHALAALAYPSSAPTTASRKNC